MYRSLPVVRSVPASDCRECKHAWTYAGDPVGCDQSFAVFWGEADPRDIPLHEAAKAGVCPSFTPRPWIRFLRWLGLRKVPQRSTHDVGVQTQIG